jgi:outer membrane immunogenic protein
MNTRFGWALASAMLLGGIGSAYAADMAPRYTKAPPPPVVTAYNWTGCYVGGNVGYGWTDDVTYGATDPFNTLGLTGGAFVPAANTGSGNGVMGGAQVGCNYQVGRSFLLGVEGDISGADVKFDTRRGPLVSTFTNSDSFFATSERVKWTASIRGRAGFVAGDWLFYGTAGWAWANTDVTANAACVGTGLNPCSNTPGGAGINAPFAASIDRNGAVYGGGVEYHLPGTQWLIGAEYLRYDFDGFNVLAASRAIATGAPLSFSGVCPAGTPCVHYTSSDLHLNEVRVRASYKFGGPVVAKY